MSKDPKDTNKRAMRVNPYTVAEGQHGWRGLSLHGDHKRKWYTVLHNERVLVTALVTLPGETSVRHSHETGELSIHYVDKYQPFVTWHPPHELHGGLQERKRQESVGEILKSIAGNPEMNKIIDYVNNLQREIKKLEERLQTIPNPQPAPRLLIDILFPPFRTTINDPRFPPIRTVEGQWYD